ncbi:hypothetical protein, partial [Curtobacterium sp. MMLR14_014]|uniref:hypothetical protein n=1 Tax=Curtobacterium sp. MMLR14_014 TaxID=1898744 RepID=UPI001C311FD4
TALMACAGDGPGRSQHGCRHARLRCALGATTSFGIGLALGTSYTPATALGEAAVGCAINAGTQYISDTVSVGAGNGVAYGDFLLTVGKIAKAVR